MRNFLCKEVIMELKRFMPVSKLTTYDVTNTAGEDLGQIENFVIDMVTGRISFAIAAFGGILGISDKWFAIPWVLLSVSLDQKRFVLEIPREILEKAPGMDKDKWPEEIDLSWLEEVYQFYGVETYW
jgi:sporulation protein YlmC with PRC-barrel domain